MAARLEHLPDIRGPIALLTTGTRSWDGRANALGA
jgi:hypothetical protein